VQEQLEAHNHKHSQADEPIRRNNTAKLVIAFESCFALVERPGYKRVAWNDCRKFLHSVGL
jgi:hypothetical protein